MMPKLQIPRSQHCVWLFFWLMLSLAAVLAFWQFAKKISPAPPKSIVMATGSEDGAHHQFGLKYQALLKQQGITLVLRTSSGSVQNLANLTEGMVDVGFVQGGWGPLASAAHTRAVNFEAQDDDLAEATSLRSLASITHKPVWIFSRELKLSAGLGALKGRRVAVGLAGSGN